MALPWTGRMSGTGRMPVQHDFIESCGLHLSFREDARLSSGNFRYCRQRVPFPAKNERIVSDDLINDRDDGSENRRELALSFAERV